MPASQANPEEIVLQTDRLILRRLCTDDAQFMLDLLNDEAFLRHIGDRGVRTLDDARQYILNGPVVSYSKHGFGFYRVELGETGVSIGIAGLAKRESLGDVDVGFAFLPAYRSQGYAYESASAVMTYARNTLGLTRIVAITSSANEDSARLLEKIGLRFERMIRIADDEPEIRLFAWAA